MHWLLRFCSSYVPQRAQSRSTPACVCRAPQLRQKAFQRCCLARGHIPQMICRIYLHWPFTSDQESAFELDLLSSFSCCSLCDIWEWFCVTSARALELLEGCSAQDSVRQQQNPHALHIQMWAPLCQLFCLADPLLLCCNTCIQGYSQSYLVCLGWTGVVITDFLHKFWD